MSSISTSATTTDVLDPVTKTFVSHVYDCKCMRDAAPVCGIKVAAVGVSAVVIGYAFGVGTRQIYKDVRRAMR